MFPDQNQWITKMAAAVRVAQYTPGSPLHQYPCSVKGIMQAFEYKGPLELLSMETCLAADPGLRGCSKDFLNRHMVSLKKCGNQYLEQIGQWPHGSVQLALLEVKL
jgi:hypothetical protein